MSKLYPACPIAIPLAALLLTGPAWADPAPDVDRIEDLSLGDLLDLETGTASWTPLAARESPGILTVLTREEIVDSGARDLLDLLRLVPGLDFGVDSAGVVSLGVRGNWAAEGKVLLLVDGIEYNETLYSALAFGNHIPVDQVERVEVIRGPGSARYGEFAELAVINVLTHTGSERNGYRVNAGYGLFDSGAWGHRSAGAAGAATLGRARIAVSGHAGQGRRSEEDYTDFYGDSYDMKEASNLDIAHGAARLTYRDLDVRLTVDHYQVRERDEFDAIAGELRAQDFTTFAVLASVDLHAHERLTLTPTLEFKRQHPWRSVLNVEMGDWDFYDPQAHRGRLELRGTYALHEDLDLVAGIGSVVDHAYTADPDWTFDGKPSVFHHNYLGYLEGVLHRPGLPLVTAGLRVEHHNHYGTAVAPRLALTKAWERAHVKALASRAFRSPAIENVHVSPDVEHEFTHVFEAEAGLRLLPWAYLTANAYHISIIQPLQYWYEYDEETDEESDGYVNEGRAGTRGLEAELRYRQGRIRGTVAYSLYQALPDNEIEATEVPGHPSAHLAFPNHKLTVRGSTRLYEGFYLSASWLVLGTRHGFVGLDADEVEQLGTFDPSTVINLQLLWTDALTPGLDLSLTCHDLLDSNPPFIQPYNGWHAPLPGPSREVLLRGSYEF